MALFWKSSDSKQNKKDVNAVEGLGFGMDSQLIAPAPEEVTGSRIYLIDYENVHDDGLDGYGALGEGDKVYFFYSIQIKNIPFERHVEMMNSKSTVEFIKTGKTAKNYLDFQLTTYLGYLLGKGEVGEIFIISKDHGFDSTVDFWQERGYRIRRQETIDGHAIVSKKAAKASLLPKALKADKSAKNDKLEKSAKNGKPDKSPKNDNLEKSDKNGKNEKLKKNDKNSKNDKLEKNDKSSKNAKLEKRDKLDKNHKPAQGDAPEINDNPEKNGKKNKHVKPDRDAKFSKSNPRDEKENAQKADSLDRISTENTVNAAPIATGEPTVGTSSGDNAGGKKRGGARVSISQLPEATRKRIRQAVKEEQLVASAYTTIYRLLLTSADKLAFNNSLVKSFGQEQGTRIYGELKNIYVEWHAQ